MSSPATVGGCRRHLRPGRATPAHAYGRTGVGRTALGGVDLAVNLLLRAGIKPARRMMGHQQTCVPLPDPVGAVAVADLMELPDIHGELFFDVVAKVKEGAVEPDNSELQSILFDRGRKIS